jgi:hypothetical protein
MASRRRRKKKCCYCGEFFLPHPRLKSKQVACSKPQCQKARNKNNQAEWKKRHPGCFKGRYPNTKRWLAEKPGYLAGYRREHPEKVQRDNQRRRERRNLAQKACADIQNSISRQSSMVKILKPLLKKPFGADIQNSISPQIIFASAFSAYLVRADIQNSIEPGLSPSDTPRNSKETQASANTGRSHEEKTQDCKEGADRSGAHTARPTGGIQLGRPALCP